MRIHSISIQNFKGLRSAELMPSRFTCLVGENNSGKSTVLQSLVFALSHPTQLPAEVFYDETFPIEFKIEIADITDLDLLRLSEEHRNRIVPLIVDNSFCLIVRYRVGEKADLSILRRVPIDVRYRAEAISAAFAGRRGAASIRQAFHDSYPEFALDAPSEPTSAEAKQFLLEKIESLPSDQFSLEEGSLPTGVPASIASFLPEPIYIPAVKNLSDDLKTTQSTSFGRLLGLLLEDMSPDLASISASLNELNGLFNRTQSDGQTTDNRHECVRNLEMTVEGFLRENFPSARVEISIPPPELRTILNSAEILIDDGSRDYVQNKGDGIKRALTFALLQCYVNRSSFLSDPTATNEQPRRPLIFLFEEPELYLHPRSQRVLFGTLYRISSRFQVIVTTHSPIFFAPDVTASFVRVAKEPQVPKPIGTLYPVNFELDRSKAETFKMARFENADAAFFSRRVVLFEGESDDAFFKHISRLIDPDWDFDTKNIAMVRVAGKGNFTRYRIFFESFGIDVKIVADLDAIFEGFGHLGMGERIRDARVTAIRQIDQRIAALGIKAEPATRQIKDKLRNPEWRRRYDDARLALQECRARGTVDEATLARMDALFVWEDDIARVRVCREDEEARLALVPILDAMRQMGVCVLATGAIEDYYPTGTSGSGSKPVRAMQAISLVSSRDVACSLSRPLLPSREPELVEICRELFSGL